MESEMLTRGAGPPPDTAGAEYLWDPRPRKSPTPAGQHIGKEMRRAPLGKYGMQNWGGAAESWIILAKGNSFSIFLT